MNALMVTYIKADAMVAQMYYRRGSKNGITGASRIPRSQPFKASTVLRSERAKGCIGKIKGDRGSFYCAGLQKQWTPVEVQHFNASGQ
jgi:hypothetical protein